MRKKNNETDEECKARYKDNYNRWLNKPGNKKRKYASDKNTQSTRFKRWQEKNKEKVRLKNANERAVRLQRIPGWADMNAIKSFYLNCPDNLHVDHIVPLRGKLVSGFHVINNLQYLSSKENLSKGNKFDIL